MRLRLSMFALSLIFRSTKTTPAGASSACGTTQDRGKAGQHGIEVGAELWNSGLAVHSTGDFSRFKIEILFCKLADIRIEIIRRVGKCGEDDDFPVAGIDGVFDFLADQVEQGLHFGIMFRCNIGNHEGQQFQIFCILFQLPLPRNIVHIGKVNPNFLPHRKIISVLIVVIEVINIRDFRQVKNEIAGLVTVNRFNGAVDQCFDTVYGKTEGIHRAFQPLEQIDAHEPADAFLAPLLRQTCPFMMGHVDVLRHSRRHDIVGRGVDRQIQGHQQVIDVVIADGIVQIRELWAQRNRRTFLGGQLASRVVSLLCLTEGLIDALGRCKFLVDLSGITLIGKCKLLFQFLIGID